MFVNDDERGLHADYEKWLEELAPHAPTSQYQHNRTGEDNADAHLKRQVIGREVVMAVTSGRLDFGPWERILYGEFDGRRRKRALVKIIREWAGASAAGYAGSESQEPMSSPKQSGATGEGPCTQSYFQRLKQ